MILPAALRHQAQLGEAVNATEGAGVDCDDSVKALEAFVRLVSEARAALVKLEVVSAHESDEPMAHAHHIKAKVRPAMAVLRTAVDALENHVALPEVNETREGRSESLLPSPRGIPITC